MWMLLSHRAVPANKYIIEWGDETSDETDYYTDSTLIEVYHTYGEEGEYIIKAKAEDEKGLQSQESTFTVKITITRSRTIYNPLYLHLIKRLSNLLPILKILLSLFK